MSRSAFACLFVFVLSSAIAPAQQNGAFYVTDRFGQHAEGNYFPRPSAANFVGGPAQGLPCGASGLADGDWYFQITSPDGSVLLSPDAIEDRRVRVQGGVIVQYLGTTHLSGGAGPCGSIFVQLFPFTITLAFDGEYKIWMTRVEDYDTTGFAFFGFLPWKCKSDNFKLRLGGPLVPQSIIRGRAFYDYDENELWNPLTEPLEVPLGGWRVETLQDDVLQGVTWTDMDGVYTIIRPRDGATRTVREQAPGGYAEDDIVGATWVATTPRTGTIVTSTEQVAGPDFGNLRFELVVGGGRPADFWSEDCDEPGCVSGESLLEASDPDWRLALNMHNGAPVNLRRPISTDIELLSVFTLHPEPFCFEIPFHVDYAFWQIYTHYPPHDHAGYLLSREVAAALLNNQFGFIQGSLLIDVHNDGILVPFEELLAGVIGLLSQEGAGLTGPDDPYQELRAQMLMCINEFSSINDTGDLAAPQVVYRRAMQPGVSSIFPYGD
jgi:hypothetical protein